jgi:hypothetical protein
MAREADGRFSRRVTGALAPVVPLTDDATSDERAMRILRAGAVVTIAAVAVQSIAHLVNVKAYDLGVNLINVDSDTGLFAWASSVATAATAVLIGMLATHDRRRSLWVGALAAAVLFLALDDMLAIHERVSELKTEIGGLEHASRLFWPLVYMPLLTAVFAGLWLLSGRIEPWPALTLRLALAALAAAIAMEMASPLLFELGFGHGSAPYELEAVAEEGLELGGWMLAGTAIAATLTETVRPEE